MRNRENTAALLSIRNIRDFRERLLGLLDVVLEILQLSLEVLLVGTEIEMAVPTVGEENRLFLARLLGLQGFIDDSLHRVGCFGCQHEALGPGEPNGCLEDLVLVIGLRVYVTVLHQPAQRRGVAVISQPTGVHGRRHEVVPQACTS